MFEELGPLTLLLVGIVFILFFLAFRQAMEVLKNAIMISIAAIIFPFLMNLAGFPVASDVNSILFYITFGLSVYFVYMFGKSFHTMLSYSERAGKKIYSPYATKVSKLNEKGKVQENRGKKSESKRKQNVEEPIEKPKFVSAKTLKSLKEEEYYVYGKEKKEEEEE